MKKRRHTPSIFPNLLFSYCFFRFSIHAPGEHLHLPPFHHFLNQQTSHRNKPKPQTETNQKPVSSHQHPLVFSGSPSPVKKWLSNSLKGLAVRFSGRCSFPKPVPRQCKDGTTTHPSRVVSNLPWSQGVERCTHGMEDGFDIVKTDSSNESLLIHVDSYCCIDGLNFEIFRFVSICINFYWGFCMTLFCGFWSWWEFLTPKYFTAPMGSLAGAWFEISPSCHEFNWWIPLLKTEGH